MAHSLPSSLVLRLLIERQRFFGSDPQGLISNPEMDAYGQTVHPSIQTDRQSLPI